MTGGIEVGVAIAALGVLLIGIAVVCRLTLRLSGARVEPIREIGTLLRDNPPQASLTLLAHLLEPGVAALAVGAAAAAVFAAARAVA